SSAAGGRALRPADRRPPTSRQALSFGRAWGVKRERVLARPLPDPPKTWPRERPIREAEHEAGHGDLSAGQRLGRSDAHRKAGGAALRRRGAAYPARPWRGGHALQERA